MSATGLDIFDKTLQTPDIWQAEMPAEIGASISPLGFPGTLVHPAAGDRLEEPGALDQMVALARDWFAPRLRQGH